MQDASQLQAARQRSGRTSSLLPPSHSSSIGGAAVLPGAADPCAAEVVPCVSAALRDSDVCLQMMQKTDDMHLNIFAADTEWLDVRVGRSGLSRWQSSTGADPAAAAAGATGAAAAAEAEWMAPAAAAAAAQQGGTAPDDAAGYAAGSEQAPGLGRVRWASCGDELVSRRAAASRSPFAGFSMDAELSHNTPARRFSTATNPAAAAAGGMYPGPRQRATVGGVPLSSYPAAHSQAPAAFTTAPDVLVGIDSMLGDGQGDAGDELGEPAAASKAASKDGDSTEAEGGDQQLGAFDLFPPLLQPAAESDKGPALAIIKVLDELPPDESAHLRCKGKRTGCRSAAVAAGTRGNDALGSSSSRATAAFKFYLGSLSDGTMAIEVRRRRFSACTESTACKLASAVS